MASRERQQARRVEYRVERQVPVISPSLINSQWGDSQKFSFDSNFDLGMDELLSDSNFDFDFDMPDWLAQVQSIIDEHERAVVVPSTFHQDGTDGSTPKRLRLSFPSTVPLKESTNHGLVSRFAKPVESPEREKAAKGVLPANTEASTRWAWRNFNAWALNCSSRSSSEAVPADLLQSHDASLVCKWLSRFVLETRKTDGSSYPPATLRSLVSGLNRVLQSNKAPFSVLDKSDHRFRDLLKTLGSVSSELHRQGVGATKHSAEVIDPKHEDIFWEKSLLGYSTPKVLQHTVFFYVGLNFVLRGVQEQYDLVPHQFTRIPQDRNVYDASVYYEYVELVSTNNQHRFKDINMQNKCT